MLPIAFTTCEVASIIVGHVHVDTAVPACVLLHIIAVSMHGHFYPGYLQVDYINKAKRIFCHSDFSVW